MQPPFLFNDIIHEELLQNDRSIFASIGADIEDSLTRDQEPGLRISDVGSCSLALWAKVRGELTMPRDPQATWSRLMAGSMFGALLGRIFKAAMDRRRVECELEILVTIDEIPGHVDIVLPVYQHIYELKSTYFTKSTGPSSFHWLQAGMYCDALGGDYTASIIMIQPTLTGARPRLIEYPAENMEQVIEDARRESFRLRRAAGAIVPPEADVLPEEKSWRCKTCQYGRCSENQNPLKGYAFA